MRCYFEHLNIVKKKITYVLCFLLGIQEEKKSTALMIVKKKKTKQLFQSCIKVCTLLYSNDYSAMLFGGINILKKSTLALQTEVQHYGF